MFLNRICLAWMLASTAALADADRSREALDRVDETLQMELERGGLDIKSLAPVLIVSVTPSTMDSAKWYPNAATQVLMRVFGGGAVRVCEACMGARVFSDNVKLEHNTTGLDIQELKNLDEQLRGSSETAKTAVWLDETPKGVSLRIVDLSNSRVLVARNFDSGLRESERTLKYFNYSKELDRRVRGDSLTHTFLDGRFIASPGITFDWVEQWGPENRHLSGFSASIFDPIAGLGFCYYHVIPQALRLTVGARLMVSIPTAIINAVQTSGTSVNGLDPLFSLDFVVRLPIAQSNWAVLASGSTNGRVGLGLSLMNLQFLPFLP